METHSEPSPPHIKVEWHQLELKYEHLRVVEPVKLSKLMTSLAQHDQQAPVLVVESCPDRFILIDGYARVQALKKLGRDLVMAVRLEMSEPEALVFSYFSQRAPPKSALEEAWLLYELTEVHGLKQAQLALRLGKSRSWISRRLSLLTVLPESVQQVVREGVVCAKAAERCLVPLARANIDHCGQMVANLGTHRTTTREMARLYQAYRTGGKQERAQLVADPLLFLKVDQERQKPDSEVLPESAAETIVNDLEAAAACCRRARKRIREQQREGEDMSLNEAVNRAITDFDSAIDALRKAWRRLPNA